jgi:phytoene synthase
MGGMTMAETAMSELTESADKEVESIVQRSGTSFYHGMRILPPPRRRAMWAIYAFCRVVDDIADEPGEQSVKETLLDEWRHRIAMLYQGQPTDPITRSLMRPVEEYGLKKQDFLAIIDGMQMDAFTEILAPSWEDLDTYCDRVASAVGRLSVRAFGDSSQRADDVAWALGRALQFTNILRDLGEDADRGRLYLPANWLADAHVEIAEPKTMLKSPRIAAVCERMEAQARRYFKLAAGAMEDCDPAAMRPARMMAASYLAVLDRLHKRGWKHPETRVRVPKLLKLWFILWHGFL